MHISERNVAVYTKVHSCSTGEAGNLACGEHVTNHEQNGGLRHPAERMEICPGKSVTKPGLEKFIDDNIKVLVYEVC